MCCMFTKSSTYIFFIFIIIWYAEKRKGTRKTQLLSAKFLSSTIWRSTLAEGLFGCFMVQQTSAYIGCTVLYLYYYTLPSFTHRRHLKFISCISSSSPLYGCMKKYNAMSVKRHWILRLDGVKLRVCSYLSVKCVVPWLQEAMKTKSDKTKNGESDNEVSTDLYVLQVSCVTPN